MNPQLVIAVGRGPTQSREDFAIPPEEPADNAPGLLAVCDALGLSAVHAQSVEEVDRRHAALIEAWEKTPLTIRRALFIDGEPRGFGLYQERGSKEFKRGEKVVAYAEPVGYGWKDAGKGMFELGFVVDFVIKTRDGEILAGKENFMRIATESHTRNLEFMVVLTLNMTSAPPCDYVVEYKLHDIASDKTASFQMPFKVVS
jgi:hypothetical protein